LTSEILIDQLSQLNGVLLTGGSASLEKNSHYRNSVEIILNYVKTVNVQTQFTQQTTPLTHQMTYDKFEQQNNLITTQQKNEISTEQDNISTTHYPLWGTCLGFEELLVITANRSTNDVLSRLNSWNLPLSLHFNDRIFNSPIFSQSEYGPSIQSVVEDLSDDILNATMHNHVFGVTIDTFNKIDKLYNNFDVLAVSNDRNNVEFISLIQWKDAVLPIYASQFHPEKVSFEWNSNQKQCHSYRCIRANRHFMDFFVGQSRKNNHKIRSFPNDNMRNDDLNRVRLIYEFQTVYTNSEYDEIYIFQ